MTFPSSNNAARLAICYFLEEVSKHFTEPLFSLAGSQYVTHTLEQTHNVALGAN